MSYFKYFSITFILSSCTTTFLDFCFPSFRIKSEKKENIKKEYYKILPISLNNLLFSWPIIDYCEYYLAKQTRSNRNDFNNFILWLSMADILFYFFHRLLHTKKFYFLHALHHSYDYSYGPGAFYAHPVDFIFANLLPIVFPLIVLKPSDNFIHFIAVFSVAFTVIVSHGSFKIFSRTHLKHHIYRTKNYGLTLSDHAAGTVK